MAGLVPAIHVVMYDRGPRCGLEENYGYFFPKIGLSVRFKILSIWIAALDELPYRTAS